MIMIKGLYSEGGPYSNIQYEVIVSGYKYGEDWYEGDLFLFIEIIEELNPNSPNNHLGKNRLVFCNLVTMENVYIFNNKRKWIWEDKFGILRTEL